MSEFRLLNNPYVLKETPDLYYIFKPAGYISENSFQVINDFEVKSIVNYVRNNLTIDDNLKNVKYRFGQLNRLDYGTNGTIIIAKRLNVYENLLQKMQGKNIKKIYIALVEGKMEKTTDFIMVNLVKKQEENKHFYVETTTEKNVGEKTLSEYYVWKTLYDEPNKKYYTLVFLRIYTGMTHQIRVHMKYIGHSLVNDFNYGKLNREINNGKIFLLSYLYCIDEYGCSIDYKKEPEIKFPNLKEITTNDYHKIMDYLLTNTETRKKKLEELKEVLDKKFKNLVYYVKQKYDSTLVNIPAGKLNKADPDILKKIHCLIDNRLHIITILDKKIEHVYFLLVRDKIKEIKNDLYHIMPYQVLKVKDNEGKTHLFTQIFVKLYRNFRSFSELENKLNTNGIFLVFDKKHGKNEVEYISFQHYHNYVFPIVKNRFLSKGFIQSIKNNAYKYSEKYQLKFKKINRISEIEEKI